MDWDWLRNRRGTTSTEKITDVNRASAVAQKIGYMQVGGCLNRGLWGRRRFKGGLVKTKADGDRPKTVCYEHYAALESRIVELESQLKTSQDIQAAEKKILISEIEKNKSLEQRNRALVEAAKQMDMLIDRLDNPGKNNETWLKFKQALKETEDGMEKFTT